MLLEFALIFLVLFVIVYIILSILARRKISRYRFDQFLFYPGGKKTERTIIDEPEVHISLVAPAYNEEERVSGFLDETVDYLEGRFDEDEEFTYEIILVNDGSKDNTVKIVRDYISEKGDNLKGGNIRLLNLVTNFGKGFAVRQGMLRARGEYILMLDSDSASKIDDLEKLEAVMKKKEKKGLGIAIGSRYMGKKDAKVERDFIRNLGSGIFHIVFKVVTGLWKIKDSQCGFKLFTRRSAALVFTNLKIERWAVDIEMLMVALWLSIPVGEIGITWREVEGSKFDFFGAMGVARDLFLIRAYYMLRIWKVRRKPALPK